MLIFFCYRVTRQTFGIKIALADRNKRADTVADATRPHDPTQEDFPAAGTRGGSHPLPRVLPGLGPQQTPPQGVRAVTLARGSTARPLPGMGRGAGRGTGADSAPAGLCQDLTVPAYPSLPGCGFVEQLTDALVQSRFVK